MTEDRELFPGSMKATLQAIRDLHGELGVVRIKDLAEESRSRGLIPSEILEKCELSGLGSLCKKALKATVANGLPYSKPIGGGEEARWKQLVLFTVPEANDSLERQSTAIDSDIEKLRAEFEFHRSRFGDAIRKPVILAAFEEASL